MLFRVLLYIPVYYVHGRMQTWDGEGAVVVGYGSGAASYWS